MGIRIDQLCISYGGAQRIIDGLDLDIAPGSFFTLLGPSGCGKTTLLRAIAGFVPVQSGRIAFDGDDVTALPAHRRDIGMVFQDYALFPNRSVFENVAYGLRARKVAEAEIRQRVPAALERVGLAAFGERLPAALSGGQRQRVALARALVIRPRVLLMDEPLSNLDAKLRVQVRETIAELQREAGITTVFVTHDQEEALALSDRIAVMQSGRIAQLGTPAEVYETPASAYVADFVGAANLLKAERRGAAATVLGVEIETAHSAGTEAGSGVAAAAAGAGRSEATVVARPEHIRLVPPAPGLLQGRLKSRQYLGVKTSCRVELADGKVVHVDQHGSGAPGAPRFEAGALVGLHFDPEKTRVLAA